MDGLPTGSEHYINRGCPCKICTSWFDTPCPFTGVTRRKCTCRECGGNDDIKSTLFSHLPPPATQASVGNIHDYLAKVSPEAKLLDVLYGVFGFNTVDTPHMSDTAKRVLAMWRSIANAQADPDFNFTVFENNAYDQLIVVDNIEFHSWCAHHLVPFFGTASIGYIPLKHLVGLSKLPRTVDHFAKRPQVQEGLTQEVGEFLWHHLQPLGIGVIMRAQHTCMSCRGATKPGTETVTSYLRGALRENPTARAEFLQLTRAH